MRMKWEELYKAWLDKNRDAIIRTEELADSAVKPAERVKKNIAVWYKTENGISYRIVHAWVFNPNTEKEEAYWEGGEPVLVPPTTTPPETFRDKAVKTLEELKKKGEIETFSLTSVDESAKNAVATTYMESAGSVQKTEKLIYEKDGKIVVKDL